MDKKMLNDGGVCFTGKHAHDGDGHLSDPGIGNSAYPREEGLQVLPKKTGKGSSSSQGDKATNREMERALQRWFDDTLEFEERWRESDWYKKEIRRVKGDIEGHWELLYESGSYIALREAALQACWRAGVRTFSPRTGHPHPDSP